MTPVNADTFPANGIVYFWFNPVPTLDAILAQKDSYYSVWTRENANLTMEKNVSALPTLVTYANGVETSRIVGVFPIMRFLTS